MAFLTGKWERELDYALRKSLWTFAGNRIAVRFQYESHDRDGQWWRSYGNELWEFDEHGLMTRREASINDLAIDESRAPDPRAARRRRAGAGYPAAIGESGHHEGYPEIRMERRIVYVSRLTRLPLLGADGADIGRVVDAVFDLGSKPPRINGLVVAVQRRRVFVGIGRIGEIGTDGARLRRGSVNLRQFELRAGERLLAGELLGTRLRGQRVVDIGLTPAPGTIRLGDRHRRAGRPPGPGSAPRPRR